MNDERQVPPDITERLKAWQFFYHLWYFWHYLFGVASIVLSLIVAFMAFVIPSPLIIALLSLFAAISTFLNYFLMPYKCAKGYVQAWRTLSVAIIEFKADESCDKKILNQAIRKGEKYIANQQQ